ncbi:MAG: 2,3-bisphosphoglycerate-independent phosphoglycerate mutase [Chitinivibrionales bacterium]|nr:2,3-bisphosphoglycerate-independent phosphoglycerate mutase [Chitinivibrionales bacterium]
MNIERLQPLASTGQSKIVLVVLDGLGGLPIEPGGKTELETANTPAMDRLAAEGICGLHVPVASGITPGSGPGHLGVFGYDPLRYEVGRGVLAALGVGFDLHPGDIAARGNFCTVDDGGTVTDRRAGRIDTETNRTLCEKLRDIQLPGAELFIETIKEHRFLLVLRGEGLGAAVDDTDPQQTGLQPRPPRARTQQAQKTAEIVGVFLDQARKRLADSAPANMVLMRGFDERPQWPQFGDIYGLRAGALASYPMYRGLARLIGMEIIGDPHDKDEEVELLRSSYEQYDFFFVHLKHTDSSGEDGDFERKVRATEDADTMVAAIHELSPDVLVVTGDHSTPSALRSHSWHPVPVVLWSKYCRPDSVTTFGERACIAGALGPRLPACELLPLAVANALRLRKFGA